MTRRILVLDGHPDPDPARYCHALADNYAHGAANAGHVVHRVNLADLAFPDITSRTEWESGLPPPAVLNLQDHLAWAEHVVIVYPLWLGAMPARLKSLLEQCLRPSFAFGGKAVAPGAGRLRGRSVRVVITMGMPAFIFRFFYFGHSLRGLKRSILGLVGMGPIRDTVIGGVESCSEAQRKAWLRRMRQLGARAG